jgi:outer membrane protein assembly factor BamB
MRLPLSLLVLVVLSGSSVLFAEDVFRFRGENSQGKYNETNLLDSWPAGGLTPKWINSELGEGWSSVAKVKDRLYLCCLDSKDSNRESVVCLDLNGKPLWQQTVGVVWKQSYQYPRATPTYIAGKTADDDRLLVLSGGGELYCLAAADGKEIWHHDVFKAAQSTINMWGVAENVVVKDGKVFVTPCGKDALAIAYNIADGSVAWKTAPIEDKVNYATPILYENYLITLTARYVSVIDIDTGKLLWQGDYIADTGGRIPRSGNNCNPPVLKGNRFFVSHGYGQGSAMYEILPDGKGLECRWSTKDLDVHHHGVVELDGRIYGGTHDGHYTCLDWDTGKTIYRASWENYGAANTIYADGKLYLYDEKRGMLGLAKPGDQFEVISSFPVEFGSQQHWPHQVISDGVLYVRRGNALAAFDIGKK